MLDKIRLSPYAEALYNEWKIYPFSYAYNIVSDQIFAESLSPEKLNSAVMRFVSEYLLLNSHVELHNEEPCWVRNITAASLEYIPDMVSQDFMVDYVTREFDLESGPLYRALLFKLSSNQYRLIMVCHHIIIGGTSANESFRLLSSYYNDPAFVAKYSLDKQSNMLIQLNNDLTENLKRNRDKYHAFWQQHFLNTDDVDLRFLHLPFCNPEVSLATEKRNISVAELKFSFWEDDVLRLGQICAKYNMSKFIFSQVIFASLLFCYTGQKRFAISYPVVIRQGARFIYGAQINTIIIPYDFSKIKSLRDILLQTNNFVNSLRDREDNIDYHYCPIIEIMQNKNKNLLNVGFIQTNLKDAASLNFLNVDTIKVPNEFNIDLVNDLMFESKGSKKIIDYRVKYNKDLIDGNLLKQFVDNYIRFFKEALDSLVIKDKDYYFNNFSLLTDNDYQKLVINNNRAIVHYPEANTIHCLFEKQAYKTPDNIALIHQNVKLTYKELNEKANQLAHYLLEIYNILPEDPVVLFLERSEHTVIAILAILKSGGYYVPIDTSYPQKRVEYILSEIKPKIVLTNRNNTVLANALIINSQDIIQVLAKYPSDNPVIQVTNTNLAYIVYTSGTTGNPKGVMVEHSSLVNTIIGIKQEIFSGQMRINMLSSTNYVFDIFNLEWALPLISGSYVELIDILGLSNKIQLNKYDCIQLTPSKVAFFIEHIDNNLVMATEHKVTLLLGGEVLLLSTLTMLQDLERKLCNNQQRVKFDIYNMYGPSETTVWSTYANVTNKSITIGKAIAGEVLYVLNANHQIAPLGAIGELYIGGVGLARGYFNNKKLTNERFIPNPFTEYVSNTSRSNSTPKVHSKSQCQNNDRLYKTGDMVRWLPNQTLEYIGRNDFQIKIAGYRVELASIENVLNNYDGIMQSIVMPIKTNLKQKNEITASGIVAYYVSSIDLEEKLIIKYLLDTLPQYMVPTQLIRLEKMPLTLNGKVDRNALPKPMLLLDNNYKPPQNNLEEAIISIWSEVLLIPKEKIGISDSFFKLGGNSLLIIQLHHKLKELIVFNDLKVIDLFKYTTVSQLIMFGQNDSNKNNIKLIQRLHDNEKDIAIIAMSGAFSGCSNLEEYWELIESGNVGLKEFSLEECTKLGVADHLLQQADFIPIAGHIVDIDKFDADFWGISKSDAAKMDPQMRKFLEHCWYLLEDAGYITLRSDLNIGVFAGSGTSKYTNQLLDSVNDTVDLWHASNFIATSNLATYVSYLLGLTGPANNINTACSTSLVTVIEACKNLAAGYCDMAIAGGVSLLLPNQVGYAYQDEMILSKDGYCRAFDIKSSGTAIGSGVGVVLLKRLADAQRDGDNIVAVIKGYATNNDGNRKVNYTAPSITGQKECIVNAQKMAGVSSDLVDYVECHGTGTKLGDSIEIQALQEAFTYNSNHRLHKCYLGAVKANIGHTDTASGIAGLIKVAKMLEHEMLPKQTNYTEANPELHIHDTNFIIPTNNISWKSISHKPRIAGISSFGIGGTNAHLVISDYSMGQNSANDLLANLDSMHEFDYILPLSANSRASLMAYKEQLLVYLSTTKDKINNIAYTLQSKRQQFEYRLAIACNSVDNAITKLSKVSMANYVASSIYDTPQDIVFMFPGQGMQYTDMSIELYKNNPAYKLLIDQCIQIVNKYLKIDFFEVLFPTLYEKKDKAYNINETELAQVALFIISYSLAKLLELLGIKATAYIGHSVGELVAAALAEVFSLEDAICLIVARGKLMQQMPRGGMLAIYTTIDAVFDFIEKYNCEIAVINTITHFLVSGSEKNITELYLLLEEKGVSAVKLNVSHAYHSSAMEVAANEFTKEFVGITLNSPKIRFISNITGQFISDKDAINPTYWANQLRNKVLFADGINTLLTSYRNPFFILVGPGKSIATFFEHIPKERKIGILALLGDAKQDDHITSNYDILSKLWMYGYKLPTNLLTLTHGKIVKLPRYCFDGDSYWFNDKNLAVNQLKSEKIILPPDKWLNTCVWEKLYPLRVEVSQINKEQPKILIFKNIEYTKINIWLFASQFIVVEIDKNQVNDYIVIRSHNHFVINPSFEVAYQKLYAYLEVNELIPEVIVHAATLVDSYTNSALENELNLGFYSLFLIQQEVLQKLSANVKFIVLTQGLAQITDADVINPSNGTMVGALRAMKHEMPNISCYIMDIGYDCILDYYLMCHLIFDDTYFKEDNLYAIKFGAVWIESFRKVRPFVAKDIINDGDVILITGGLGKIGLSIANYISQQKNVTFILVSKNSKRDSNSEQSIVAREKLFVQRIQDNQCIVDVRFIDVSDIGLVNKLIQNIHTKYGKLSGIIHVAGNMPLNTVDRNLVNVKHALIPKVHGAFNLISATKSSVLEYFVMVSSLASILGDINRVEYCAANGYLDYLATAKLLPNSCYMLSVNWPGWGIFNNQKNRQLQNYEKLLLSNVFSYEDGAKLFYSVMQQANYNRIIISKLDLKLLKELLFDIGVYDKSWTSHDIKSMVIESHLSEKHYKIANVFINLLNVSKISIHDDFFELGGTSILAVKLIAQLKKLGINLSLNDIVNCPSIDKICKFFVLRQLPAVDSIVIPLLISNKTNKNIFFIHPIGGTVILYHRLIKRMPHDYNYYGIQNIDALYNVIIKADTISELATKYLHEILEVQQDGEFILMGASMGGTIAYELAIQLCKLGKKVKLVGMFDTWAIFSEHFSKKNVQMKMIESLYKHQEMFLSSMLSKEHSDALTNASLKHLELLINYTPQQSSIKIYLYKARNIAVEYITNGNHYDNAWQQYTSEKMSIFEIPGDHHTIFEEPGFSMMVKYLSDLLLVDNESSLTNHNYSSQKAII